MNVEKTNAKISYDFEKANDAFGQQAEIKIAHKYLRLINSIRICLVEG